MSSKRPVSTSSAREQSHRRYPASPAICMYVIRHTLPGMRRGRILSTGSTDITYSNMVGRNGMHRSIPDLDTEIDQDLGAPISACTRTDNCREKSRKHCFSGNHKGANYISQLRASGHAIVAAKRSGVQDAVYTCVWRLGTRGFLRIWPMLSLSRASSGRYVACTMAKPPNCGKRSQTRHV